METFKYDNRTVYLFLMATVFWGAIGMLVGLLIALQLIYPELNFGIPWLTYSHLRALHTNSVIFAFVGNGMFTGIYYSLQRLLKARMYSDVLSRLHFWGWQAIIVGAAITIPLGHITGKEYAELEWPLDILVAVVWVIFGLNMFGTILNRRERHMYVAIWFYIATVVTVAMLHIVNSLAIPVSFLKSYPIYAGVQDALVQWWYGHNAVAFFLTTPYLGLMYYFLPKAANRPVYSYRLSIVHFWTLVFLYIWAGPHHLLYTALPDWAQSLGTVFSVMLIVPSWGGMVNGLLTLRGAWDRVREDPVLKFMVVAVTAYGMATLEGPLLSLKNVNAISHYTNWTIAHAHVGALGWNGFLTFGMLYWLIPRLWQTTLYSRKLANTHFWIGTLGIIFYAVPLYWAAWQEASMAKQFDADGYLKYSNWQEIVNSIMPFFYLRAFGGALYLTGVGIMVYNLVKTAYAGCYVGDETAQAAPLAPKYTPAPGMHWHRTMERRPLMFGIVALVVVMIGGILEIIPTFMVKSNVPTISSVQPYTPLELEGRDIYVREGCNTCHSQMIRPFRSETERYGEYSKAGEFVYDHPFLWGSRRVGPDLHRVGRKYSHAWHYHHLVDPQRMAPGSIMPPYPWLAENKLDTTYTRSKIFIMRRLGVPYPEGYEQQALRDLNEQAGSIAQELQQNGISATGEEEIVALIAYLQRLGTDISKGKTASK